MKVDHSTLRDFLKHVFSKKEVGQAQMEKIVARRHEVRFRDEGDHQENFSVPEIQHDPAFESLAVLAIDAFYRSFGYRRHDPQDRTVLGYSKDGGYQGEGFLVTYAVVGDSLRVTVQNFAFSAA